mgnify:CR=1 FL=1
MKFWKDYTNKVKGDLTNPMTYTSFLDDFTTPSSSSGPEPFSKTESSLADLNKALDKLSSPTPEKKSGFSWLKNVYGSARDTLRPFTDPIAKYGGKALGIAAKGYEFLPDDLKGALQAKYLGMYDKIQERFADLKGKYRGQRVGLNLSGSSRSIPGAGRVNTTQLGGAAYGSGSVASKFIQAAGTDKDIIDQIKKSYDIDATKKGSQTITLSAVGDISPSKYRKFSSV